MRLRVVLRVAVTAGFLGWLLHQFGAWSIAEALGRAPRQCAEAALLTVVMIVTMALRWQLLLRALNVCPKLGEIVRATFAGCVAGTFLPSVGGDVVKIALIVRERSVAGAVAVSTVVDRSFGLVSLFGLGLVATVVHGPSPRLGGYVRSVYIAVSVPLLLMVGIAMAARRVRLPAGLGTPISMRFLDRLIGLTRHVGSAMDLYAGRKMVLMQALGLAVVSQLISILIYYRLAHAVGATTSVLDFFYGVPLVTLAAFLPISVGGIGVSEWAFIKVFTDLGMSSDATLAVSLLNLVARLAGTLIGSTLPWTTTSNQR